MDPITDVQDVEFKFKSWAVIELTGRAIIAGRVETYQVGGVVFWRVDVPKVGMVVPEPFSKIYGSAAIWCVTPCTEDVVKMTLLRIKPEPLKAVSQYHEGY
jgi:hypothetical protein